MNIYTTAGNETDPHLTKRVTDAGFSCQQGWLRWFNANVTKLYLQNQGWEACRTSLRTPCPDSLITSLTSSNQGLLRCPIWTNY